MVALLIGQPTLAQPCRLLIPELSKRMDRPKLACP